MKLEKNPTIQYIYGLLSFWDILWLKLHKKGKITLSHLAYYITPRYGKSVYVSDFRFIEDKYYRAELEQRYARHKEYQNMSVEERIAESPKGYLNPYRNLECFNFSDWTIPDKFKPFITTGDCIVGKFPIPMHMKDEFVVFLFHYLQKNAYLTKEPCGIAHWFAPQKGNKRFKDRDEMLYLSDDEIDKMYRDLCAYTETECV